MQTRLFIDGEFVEAASGGKIEVLNPFDNSRLCEIEEARAEDVDRAVAAAKAAFPAWSRMDAADRGQILLRLADLIEARADELIDLEARDTGHPVRDARKLDVPRTARCFRYFGGMADKFEGNLPPVYPGFINYVQREPIGVVGFYDVQQPDEQPEMNMRGKFVTGADGCYTFRTMKPVSYPVPTDGPVGRMLDAMGRHAYRPAHIHFIVTAPGYEPVVTHIFVEGDPYIESDAVFGVKQSLIVPFTQSTGDDAPWTAAFDFTLAAAA